MFQNFNIQFFVNLWERGGGDSLEMLKPSVTFQRLELMLSTQSEKYGKHMVIPGQTGKRYRIMKPASSQNIQQASFYSYRRRSLWRPHHQRQCTAWHCNNCPVGILTISIISIIHIKSLGFISIICPGEIMSQELQRYYRNCE